MARLIPRYALYGDGASEPQWRDAFDFEWIPQRSRAYNWDIQPHVHEGFIQLLYLTQGEVDMSLNDARWHAAAPCLLVIPAQNVHGFRFTPDVDGPVITAAQGTLESFAAVLMPELLHTLRQPAVLQLPRAPAEGDALMPIFRAIEHELRGQAQGHVQAAMALLTALFVKIARIGQPGSASAPGGRSRKHEQVEKFRTLVEQHFKQRLGLPDYADRVGVSAGQLSRVCREVLGISALEVINARILHEAQRNLIYTSGSVKQLASALGFVDEAYFGRFFRKHTGLTPREFRAKAQEGASPAARRPR